MKHLLKQLASLLVIAVLTLGAVIPALALPSSLSDGTYTPASLTSSLGMFKFTDDYHVVVKGNDAWLVVTSTTNRYDRMILAPHSDQLTATSGTEGIPVMDGETVSGYIFAAPLAKADLESAINGGGTIVYTLRYRADYTDSSGSSANAGKWYKGKNADYFFTLGALTKTDTSTALPSASGSNPSGQGSGGDLVVGSTLSVINTTNMFKAASASLQSQGEQTYLVVALGGTSYRYLFPGTYEEAVANGDQRDNWISGAVNEGGKYEFALPLAAGQTVVPAVSVSGSYLAKYEKGENPLARAFYPRQFVIDYEANTVTVGDYESSSDLSVSNGVKMFSVSAASLHTVGGVNSNNYKTELVLTMGSTSFDKAYIGSGSEITESAALIELNESNAFAFPLRHIETAGDPDSVVSLLELPLVISFHSVKKDAWYDRVLTASEQGGTLVIRERSDYQIAGAEEQATPEWNWNGGSDAELTVTVVRQEDDGATFSHFAGVLMDGRVVSPDHYEARSGSLILSFKPSYLRTLSDGAHTVSVLFDDGQVSASLTVKNAVVSPDTGDAGVAVWLIAALFSLTAAALLLHRKAV